MKIIIVLALAGLSLATDTCVPENTESDLALYLKFGLKETSRFLPAFAKFLCYYYGTIEYNEANYNEAFHSLIDILECIGCPLSALTGLDQKALESILQAGGEAVKGLGEKVVLKLTDHLGVTEDIARALCKVFGDGLTSVCAQNLLMIVDKTLLTKIICKIGGDVTSAEVVDLLSNGGCLGDVVLGNEDDLIKIAVNLGLTNGELLAIILDVLRDVLLKLGINLCDGVGLGVVG